MKQDDSYSFEEEFHQKDRKQFKKERKLASQTDRSKFKKTDLQKKKEVHYDANDGTVRARVLAITGEGILVKTDTHEMLCSLRGLLKKERTHDKNLIAVGDFVQVEPSSEKQGHVLSVEDRTSFLAREDISRRKKQLIAANIDQVLIITSVVSPPLKPFLIDRYIIAAHKGNMSPMIIINKIDLLHNQTEERLFYQEFLEAYKPFNIPILSISAFTKEGLDQLKTIMKGKASVLSGQSGVGKSTLINEILGLELPVGDVTHKTQKGSHTTTTAQLIPMEEGGFCIDTPGIKGFGIWELTIEEIVDHFPEIKAVAQECKYPNCLHMEEPECAVLKAVKEGKIPQLRFQSYLSLIVDAQSHTI